MAHDVPDLLQRMMQAMPGNQTQIAARLSTRALKVPQPQVSRWINGQKPDVPSYERIVAVAVELGVLPPPDSDLDEAEYVQLYREVEEEVQKSVISILKHARKRAKPEEPSAGPPDKRRAKRK